MHLIAKNERWLQQVEQAKETLTKKLQFSLFVVSQHTSFSRLNNVQLGNILKKQVKSSWDNHHVLF